MWYIQALKDRHAAAAFGRGEPESRFISETRMDPMISKTTLQSDDFPRVRLILKPGQRGTKKLAAEYGHRFVCARYRYDPIRKKRLKTVELIVEEKYWKPESYQRMVPNVAAYIRIDIQESRLRQTVKDAGGKWNPVHKVWELPLSTVYELDLEDRIVFKEDLEKHL